MSPSPVGVESKVMTKSAPLSPAAWAFSCTTVITGAAALTLGETDTEGLTDTLGLTDTDGETETEGLTDTLGETLTLGLTLIDGETEGEALTEGLVEAEGEVLPVSTPTRATSLVAQPPDKDLSAALLPVAPASPWN